MADLFERGIHGKGQIDSGIDERAIEIENQHANIREGRQLGIWIGVHKKSPKKYFSEKRGQRALKTAGIPGRKIGRVSLKIGGG